jgi:hypothetical protein
MCTNGYVVKEGCKICACVADPPCVCGPTKSDPIKCDDGSISDYLPCVTTNNCAYVRRQCPLRIEVTMTNGQFTAADLDKFKQVLRIEDKDISYTETTNDKGVQQINIWVERDAIPTEKKDNDVALEVQNSIKSSGGKDGIASVVNAPTPNSFGTTLIVSIVSLVIVLFA